ncbi:transposable element Tcb2 transposase [Trichonephila clavipes]|nr:transposable element Tcb2 transposase [Trichonephila clavipes]
MTAQRHVRNILQSHVLPFMQRLPGAIFQQDIARPETARVSQDILRTVTTLLWSASSPDLSPIEYIWDPLGWRVGYLTFERTRSNVTENMERNVFQDIQNMQNCESYRTCMTQCVIVSHRAFALEGVQQGIKSSLSVLLPFSLIF